MVLEQRILRVTVGRKRMTLMGVKLIPEIRFYKRFSVFLCRKVRIRLRMNNVIPVNGIQYIKEIQMKNSVHSYCIVGFFSQDFLLFYMYCTVVMLS
jgi:hypothetical protein